MLFLSNLRIHVNLCQEKMSGLVTPSPMTPDHDAFDDISNASRPTTPVIFELVLLRFFLTAYSIFIIGTVCLYVCKILTL